MSAKSDLLASLPLDFTLEGHVVSLVRRGDSSLAIQVQAVGEFCDDQSKREVASFIRFLLAQPAGMPLLTFSNFEQIDHRRVSWIARCFGAWRHLDGPKDKQGRLKQSMHCVGVVDATSLTLLGTCARRTKDVSGTCPQHRTNDTKTLWSYDPFTHFEQQVQRIIDTHDEIVTKLDKIEAELD